MLPGLVAAAMVLPVLGRASPTTDEAATWSAAHRSWSELARLLHLQDAVFALYYALMHLWIDVAGQAPAVMRAPSAIAGIAGVVLVSRLGIRLTGRPAGGLVAGLSLALSPFFLYYSIDARPYAFVALIAVITTGVVLSERSRSPWLWAALTILGAWLQLLYLLVAAAQLIAVLSFHRDRRRAYAAAGLAVVVATAPLAWLAAGQRSQIAWLGRTRISGYETWWPHLLGVSGATAIAAAVLAVVGALSLRRARTFETVLLVAMTVLPPLALLTVSWVLPLYDGRYVIESAPPAALLIASGAVAAAASRWRLATALTAGSTLLAQAPPAWAHQHRPYFYENESAAAADVLQAVRPDSALIALPGEARAGLYYYFDRNQDGDLPLPDISIGQGSAPVAAANFSGRQQPLAAITAAAAHYRRIVLVTLGETTGSTDVVRVEASLRRLAFVQTQQEQFGLLTVDVFQRSTRR